MNKTKRVQILVVPHPALTSAFASSVNIRLGREMLQADA
jgi:hypothetical protein